MMMMMIPHVLSCYKNGAMGGYDGKSRKKGIKKDLRQIWIRRTCNAIVKKFEIAI